MFINSRKDTQQYIDKMGKSTATQTNESEVHLSIEGKQCLQKSFNILLFILLYLLP